MIHSFPPVADSRSRVLILGSMPGEASLAKAQYYGHPRNHFWPLLYALFGGGTPDAAYEERLAFALRHRIALWDVLQSCEREGSLDSAIRCPVASDFAAFLTEHPRIAHLFLNGTAAARLFAKHVRLPEEIRGRLTVTALPSSSPANTMPLERKLAAWQAVRESLKEQP
ncbi:DNA-deoxyinosine glycosylase [Paenibacillus hamazuiensis]|uniref:DNA-deoxyinosine glycosylase n=1 Tax=Paenibacillus hamazuiensis TaxID=2936508 RepID=UPI00200EB88F|nr:DNA-deoxyinosine glycosylase [Paenibacillus hamazuiensis]